jgi:Nucleoside-diphosphate-sugar epimerases
MRLFLTGATGFVGRNLLLAALEAGQYSEIVAAVRDRSKLERQLADEGVHPGDRLRTIGWDEAPPADVDHAVHCAGVLFARDRESYFRVNVGDTLRLLAPIRNDARVLVLSSQSAGGPTPVGREARSAQDPDTPITWYGESKLEMERRLRKVRPGAMIWRPPMILGPRDQATLPLFKMAAGIVRLKPGLHVKRYSWIGVNDLVRAILRALQSNGWECPSAIAACAPGTITDLDLLSVAAELGGGRGVTVRLPGPLLRVAAAAVDAVPAWRAAVPSLTRDRAREIAPRRWVLDGSEFQRRFSAGPFQSLREVLKETRDWYVRAGLLP